MSIKSQVIIGFRILNIVIFFVLIYWIYSTTCSFCATREDAIFAIYRTKLESVNMNIDINKSVKFNINKIEDKNSIKIYNEICFGVIDKANFKYPEIAKKLKKKYCKDSYMDMIKRMLIFLVPIVPDGNAY